MCVCVNVPHECGLPYCILYENMQTLTKLDLIVVT